MALAYREALDFLFPRVSTIKFGLETTRALLQYLGHPERVVPVVHVGGTNGKGSVALLIAEVLRAAGWRVGLYTSPHLVSFRERIRVDGVPISENAVAMWTEKLRSEVDRLGATFFEATTAIAFADMVQRGAEIMVVEVGLGGRLDSTNVVDPLVSVVTKIALDHQKYLGNDLEAIAREKAWIAKAGRPFVVGEEESGILEVLRAEAETAVRRNDPAGHLAWCPVPAGLSWTKALGLVGVHQHRNAAVAAAALAHLPPPYRPADRLVEEIFPVVQAPGRFQRWGNWVFDVAHNPDGVEALVRTLHESALPRPIHAMVSILGDKEWARMLTCLEGAIDWGILTTAPTGASRGWEADWVHRWLGDADARTNRWKLVPNFSAALEQVRQGAGTVLVTGSFHTVGDVQAALGIAEVMDPAPAGL